MQAKIFSELYCYILQKMFLLVLIQNNTCRAEVPPLYVGANIIAYKKVLHSTFGVL